MSLPFVKYHGAGNDFVIIDQRDTHYISRKDVEQVALLCHRRFGIGADGLMLLQRHDQYDFEMIYFNADGRESTLCGNGSRCIVAYAHALGMIDREATFLAIDGPHKAKVIDPKWIELRMNDLSDVSCDRSDYVLNTGSPHYVRFMETHLREMNVQQAGSAIRNSKTYQQEGINVNFVHINAANDLAIRTYERGVEAETLACGTGVTAAALAFAKYQELKMGEHHHIDLHAEGGDLAVKFFYTNSGTFEQIWLCGPAEFVFSGETSEFLIFPVQ